MDAPIYVFEDAVNFIAERCNTDRETIEKILMLEDDYMRSVGIIIEEMEWFKWKIQKQKKKEKKNNKTLKKMYNLLYAMEMYW